MSTILLVGNDEVLLQSRAAVLRTINAKTVTADACDLTRHVITEPVDLVVLCHTLNPAVRLPLSNFARREWPGVRVLQFLKSENERPSALDYADEFVLAIEPATFVRRASELLSGSRLPMLPRSETRAIMRQIAKRA